MKKLIITLSALYITIVSIAQIKNPIQWSYSSKKIADKTYELHATAILEPGWHIYSQTTGKGGPVPTSFTFNNNPLVTITGAVKELGKIEKTFDKNFNTTVKYYSKKVDFIQTVKLKANVKTDVTGEIQYMLCNDKNCLPPKKISFTISLP